MDLLKITTAGSVDDGKSTLIGRLLYDNGALTKEQEELVHKKTKEKGLNDLDFSVITDGLTAEREQGITIDVAHIYFSSATRKFIIADSPGHFEYTRNMVTGASNAEISIILIDARKGLLEQSHRHFFITQLLKLHTVVFCINKMDLIDYKEQIFIDISKQIHKMLNSFKSISNIEIIPISSLKGDNVVNKSINMLWYNGHTLNEVLHNIKSENFNLSIFRFDVQNVLHVQNNEFKDYRGYAGKIISGKIKVGDSVMVLPSHNIVKITEIRKYKDVFDEAKKNDSVIISIDKDIDISRGSFIVKNIEKHLEDKNINATLVWLEESNANIGDKYIIQSGTRTTQAKLQNISYIIPPENPNHKETANTLKLNNIANVNIRLAQPIYLDDYKTNKSNGAFILVNMRTNNTCAVGFVNILK